MKLCTGLIADELAKTYTVSRQGSDVETLILEPPMFLLDDAPVQSGRTVICTADALMKADLACGSLAIVSGSLEDAPGRRHGSVLCIAEQVPIGEVFNAVQGIFLRYSDWESRLQSILDGTSDIDEMVEITAELIDECIAVTNRHLEIASFCNPRWGTPMQAMHLVGDGVRVFQDSHEKNVARREPFLFDMEGRPIYCLNIYKNDEYLGILSVPSLYHDLSAGRMRLVDHFYGYLVKAVDRLSPEDDHGMESLETVFRSILKGEAVEDERVLESVRARDASSRWMCLAVRFTEPMRKLPSEYYCRQIAEADEKVVAIDSEDHIAVLVPVPDDGTPGLSEDLTAVIDRVFSHAGGSIVFNNLANARTYFHQAIAALKTGLMRGKREIVYSFGDNAFDYMLDRCVGEFTPKYLLPKALLELRDDGGGAGNVDYWHTLKCYLDNGMSATATARELYIHRTTLQYRLEKIKERIDVSDPRMRLYIHLCMYLYDAYEVLFGN